MNIALAIDQGRVAALFPGVEIWILRKSATGLEKQIVTTHCLQESSWGKKLLSHDIDTLLCAGIEQFTLGIVKGYGIRVVSDLTGPAEDAVNLARAGLINIHGSQSD